MNKEDHIQRHRTLHYHLDELVADYVSSSNKLLENTTVLELLEWSHLQTINPFESPKDETSSNE